MRQSRKLSSALILGIFALYLTHQSLPHQHLPEAHTHGHETDAHHHHGEESHQHHQHNEHNEHHAQDHQDYKYSFLNRLLEKHAYDHDHHDLINFYTSKPQKSKVGHHHTFILAVNVTPLTQVTFYSNSPGQASYTLMANYPGSQGQRAPPNLNPFKLS